MKRTAAQRRAQTANARAATKWARGDGPPPAWVRDAPSGTEQVNTRMAQGLHTEMHRACDALSVSQSEFMRAAVRALLADVRDGVDISGWFEVGK